jgi:hypothetical protein
MKTYFFCQVIVIAFAVAVAVAVAVALLLGDKFGSLHVVNIYFVYSSCFMKIFDRRRR